jgi:hypothetical protein
MAVVLAYLDQDLAALPLQALLVQLVQMVIQEVAEHMAAVVMVIQLAKVVQ